MRSLLPSTSACPHDLQSSSLHHHHQPPHTITAATSPPILPPASHRLLIPASTVLILGANRGSPHLTPPPLIRPPLPPTRAIAVATSSSVMQMEVAWEQLRAIQTSCAAYMEFVQIYYDVIGEEGDEVSVTEGSGNVEGEVKGGNSIDATEALVRARAKWRLSPWASRSAPTSEEGGDEAGIAREEEGGDVDRGADEGGMGEEESRGVEWGRKLFIF